VDADRGRRLLSIARQAIVGNWENHPANTPHELWLDEPGATFVTLTKNGKLRGCVGSLVPSKPLRIDVELNARSAAFLDPRFPPVDRSEVGQLDIEVSKISPLQRLEHQDEADLLNAIETGVDGLLLQFGCNRGTFLPQVWELIPEPKEFLRQLKVKAGLDSHFWSRDISVSRYTVTKWRERG